MSLGLGEERLELVTCHVSPITSTHVFHERGSSGSDGRRSHRRSIGGNKAIVRVNVLLFVRLGGALP